eukprot:gene10996-7639_t
MSRADTGFLYVVEELPARSLAATVWIVANTLSAAGAVAVVRACCCCDWWWSRCIGWASLKLKQTKKPKKKNGMNVPPGGMAAGVFFPRGSLLSSDFHPLGGWEGVVVSAKLRLGHTHSRLLLSTRSGKLSSMHDESTITFFFKYFPLFMLLFLSSIYRMGYALLYHPHIHEQQQQQKGSVLLSPFLVDYHKHPNIYINREKKMTIPAPEMQGLLTEITKLTSETIHKELTRILHDCGVTRFLHSTQLYPQPSTIHVLSFKDLLFLVDYAAVLITSSSLSCDFRSLFAVLWSMLQDGERVTTELLQRKAGGERYASAAAATSSDSASHANALYTSSSWWGTVQAHMTADEQKRVTQSLRCSDLVCRLLTALLLPQARKQVRESVFMGPQDVERVLRFHQHLNQIFLGLADDIETRFAEGHQVTNSAPGSSKNNNNNNNSHNQEKEKKKSASGRNGAYGVELHNFFLLVEGCYLRAQQLLVELPRQDENDVERVVKAMYCTETWEASGISDSSASTYFRAVRQLILTTERHRKKIPGLESALSQIVRTRLLRRPGYRHHPFRMSHQIHRHDHELAAAYYLAPTFGVLQSVWTAVEGLEEILCANKGSVQRPRAFRGLGFRLTQDELNALQAVTRRTAAEFHAEMAELQKEGRRLSYFQLLGLSILDGMPPADLTKAEDLLDRAQSTNLLDASVPVPGGDVSRWGDFLGLLQAVCYTTRIATAGAAPGAVHAPVPLPCLVPLLNAVCKYIYQEPSFERQAAAGTKASNTTTGGGLDASAEPLAPGAEPRGLAPPLMPFHSPFTISHGPHINRLVRLAVDHPTFEEVGKPDNAPLAPAEVTETIAALQQRISGVAQRVYDGCAVLRKEISQPASRDALRRVPPPAYERFCKLVEVVTSTLRQSLSYAVDNASLSPSLLTSTLEAAARLFAAFKRIVFHALPNKSSDPVAKEFSRFVALLRVIPSVMKVPDVDAVFTKTLVPLVLPSMMPLPSPKGRGAAASRPSPSPIERGTLDPTLGARKWGIEYDYIEGYLRAFSTPTAAFCVADDHLLQYWADVGTACMTGVSPLNFSTLIKAGHDFFAAAFCSQRTLAPLLMPSFICVMVPAQWNAFKYREPPMLLLRHFAVQSRYVCQQLLACDESQLQEVLSDPSSPPRRFLAELEATGLKMPRGPRARRTITATTTTASPDGIADSAAQPQTAATASAPTDGDGSMLSYLRKTTPTNAVLLLVSSLFDKVCLLLHLAVSQRGGVDGGAASQPEHWARFSICYSALCNLVQCDNFEVVSWVCESLESVLLEHMQHLDRLIPQCLKFLDGAVAQTNGTFKKQIAVCERSPLFHVSPQNNVLTRFPFKTFISFSVFHWVYIPPNIASGPPSLPPPSLPNHFPSDNLIGSLNGEGVNKKRERERAKRELNQQNNSKKKKTTTTTTTTNKHVQRSSKKGSHHLPTNTKHQTKKIEETRVTGLPTRMVAAHTYVLLRFKLSLSGGRRGAVLDYSPHVVRRSHRQRIILLQKAERATSQFPTIRHATNIASGLGRVVSATLCSSSLAAPPQGAVASSSSAASIASPTLSAAAAGSIVSPEAEAARRQANIRYMAVPSTRISRVANFGSLFVQIGWDRLTGSGKFTPESHERIVETLCRMRGAVLKLGQMLSIQDENTIPSHITALFNRVRDQAFAMPRGQLLSTLTKEFRDPQWKEKIFSEFDETPMAAASIGQVHRGKLRCMPPGEGNSSRTAAGEEVPAGGRGAGAGEEGPEVAIKVQYPGVAKSIDSDIGNLRSLFRIGILPPGMFVEQVLQELRSELMEECQYLKEAAKQQRYRQLLLADPKLSQFFNVPKVYAELCTQQMIVSDFVRGIPIDKVASNPEIPVEYRAFVAEQLLSLTLTELFQWRFMQTDPNFANFLFETKTNKVHLLDFGAAREYPGSFVEDYLDVVAAAAREDREMVVKKSISLGFLTGREVKEMIDAHVESVLLLGKPFRNRDGLYDFASENIPKQVQKLVPTMVKLRLKPPPIPAYSLHRRLSGTILLCTRLKAAIPSGKVFWDIHDAQRP